MEKNSTTHGAFKGKIELKKYSRKEYESMSMVQHQQLYAIQKSKKTPESSRALETRVAALEAKRDTSSNESLFSDEMTKANKRSNPDLDRKRSSTR